MADRSRRSLQQGAQGQCDLGERSASEDNLNRVPPSGRWRQFTANIQQAVTDFFLVEGGEGAEGARRKWAGRSMKLRATNPILGSRTALLSPPGTPSAGRAGVTSPIGHGGVARTLERASNWGRRPIARAQSGFAPPERGLNRRFNTLQRPPRGGLPPGLLAPPGTLARAGRVSHLERDDVGAGRGRAPLNLTESGLDPRIVKRTTVVAQIEGGHTGSIGDEVDAGGKFWPLEDMSQISDGGSAGASRPQSPRIEHPVDENLAPLIRSDSVPPLDIAEEGASPIVGRVVMRALSPRAPLRARVRRGLSHASVNILSRFKRYGLVRDSDVPLGGADILHGQPEIQSGPREISHGPREIPRRLTSGGGDEAGGGVEIRRRTTWHPGGSAKESRSVQRISSPQGLEGVAGPPGSSGKEDVWKMALKGVRSFYMRGARVAPSRTRSIRSIPRVQITAAAATQALELDLVDEGDEAIIEGVLTPPAPRAISFFDSSKGTATRTGGRRPRDRTTISEIDWSGPQKMSDDKSGSYESDRGEKLRDQTSSGAMNGDGKARRQMSSGDLAPDQLSGSMATTDSVFNDQSSSGEVFLNDITQRKSTGDQISPSGLYPQAVLSGGVLPRIDVSSDDDMPRNQRSSYKLLRDETSRDGLGQTDWLGKGVDEPDSAHRVTWTRLPDEEDDSASKRLLEDADKQIFATPHPSGVELRHPAPSPPKGAQYLGGMKRIPRDLLVGLQGGERRRLGEGLAGAVMGWSQRRSGLSPDVTSQIDNIEADMHRPYFTYWVTFVQIVCFIVAVSVSGISTIGVSQTVIQQQVLTTSLTEELVERVEIDNMWIGPRQADLIHLGARYTLCMRRDANLGSQLLDDLDTESETACCVRNDGSGAVQTSREKCSSTLATWVKWNGSSDSIGRHSGSVCGQDPRFCISPASQGPFAWDDDITQWPICRERGAAPPRGGEGYRHMLYEVVGRPCCVGIQGQCAIVTREHCAFLRGHFHEEAALCAQVNCMDEICGMIPFWNPSVPDQLYRLWTSLFIHAGLLELVVTVVVQMVIMRDLEKLAGWLRVLIIYCVSGIGGSLGSAVFLPYHVEAGPSGCQFGLLACLLVEVVHNWSCISSPRWALAKLVAVALVCLLLGFLPLVDNFAHVFGFVFGFLLSFALLPYVTFDVVDRRGKIVGIVACLTVCVLLLAALTALFYAAPVYGCSACRYFNCIPFSATFCSNAEVEIVRAKF